MKHMALGDCFSAGNGAGNPVLLDPPAFDRTDGSYVYQLYNDKEVFVKSTPILDSEFEFNACSSAVIDDILNLQMQTAVVPYHPFVAGVDLYTLKAGGNDMGFDQIVEAYVYNIRFYGSCKSLDAFNGYLASNRVFQNNLAALSDNLQIQACRYATVVILLYITFYNDQVSCGWDCWVSPAALRMNRQVTKVNAGLRTAADAHVFRFVEETSLQAASNGYRFCESGAKWI